MQNNMALNVHNKM